MEEAHMNAAVAQLIYAARIKAGLSQAQLGGANWDQAIGDLTPGTRRLRGPFVEDAATNRRRLGQRLEISFISPSKASRERKPDTAVLEPA
jgi:hypothetical protein